MRLVEASYESSCGGNVEQVSDAVDFDSIRIGTREREDAIRLLGDHFSEGRLEAAEYENRAAQVAAAATRGELAPLFRDLPAPHPACLAPPPSAFDVSDAPAARASVLAPAEHQESDRHQIIAGVLQIVLPFGIGRFYTGHNGMAMAQLFVTIFTLGIGAIWSFVDGILLLLNGGEDSYGRRLRS